MLPPMSIDDGTSPPQAIDTAFLESLALFGGIRDEALARLAAVLKRRQVGPGQVVAAAGDAAREMFIVESGEVEVVAYRQPRGALIPGPPPPPGSECELILAVMTRGTCCGEMALLDIQPRSASLRTRGPATLLSLAFGDVQQLHQRDPATFTLLMMNIAREVSRRLREANRVLVEVLLSLPGDLSTLLPPDTGPELLLN